MSVPTLVRNKLIFAAGTFVLGVVLGTTIATSAWSGPTAAPPGGGKTISLLGLWANGSGGAVYYSGGSVGIAAATAPAGTLESFNAGAWNNTENVANGIETSSGHTNGTDYTLYMGADATNHNSYLQSVQWGTAVAPLTLNARGGAVGINTNNPSATLTVNGMIQTTVGGIKYPDGTVQTSAN
jgi:hypothetical protein